MTNGILWLALVAGLTGCADRADRAAVPGDTLSQHQRDSVVAASKLPGAKAVQGARDAANAVEARQRAADSIR